MKIFLLECKRILKSPLFWISLVVIFFFTFSDFTDYELHKPEPGRESYGDKSTKDMSVIRENSIEELLMSFSNNSYITYPIGFYRNIRLDDVEQRKMEKLLSSLLEVPVEELEYSQDLINKANTVNISDNEFLDMMEQVDKILGGGSDYSPKLIKNRFGVEPMTYEEAMEDYDTIVYKDKVSGAFARYYNDYLGIIVAFIPIILAVDLWYRDKKKGVNQILYSKKIPTTTLVIARSLAMIFMFFVGILFITTWFNIRILQENSFLTVSPFRMYITTILWTLPTLCFVVTFGTFLTLLTNTPLGIFIGFFGWLISNFIVGSSNIQSSYGFQLVMRHNTIGNTLIYYNSMPQIFLNRFIWLVISVLLVVFSTSIYSKRREGRFGYGSAKTYS